MAHSLPVADIFRIHIRMDEEYRYRGLFYINYVTHSFVPVAIETLGAIGPRSLVFLRELGRRVRRQTGNILATSSLLQKLSVAVQRGNAATVMGGLRGCS